MRRYPVRSEGALCCKACDLSMKKFSYNKIFCDICGMKDNNETSAAQQSVSGFCLLNRKLFKSKCV